MTTQPGTFRLDEFSKAMEMYKKFGIEIASYLCLGRIDRGWKEPLQKDEENDWRNSLISMNLKPDIVLTHNSCGDYGHNHHKSLNSIVHSLFPDVLEFAYPGDKNFAGCPNKDQIIYSVTLTTDVLAKKNEIMRVCYTSQSKLWTSSLNYLMDFYFNRNRELFTSVKNEILL